MVIDFLQISILFYLAFEMERKFDIVVVIFLVNLRIAAL